MNTTPHGKRSVLPTAPQAEWQGWSFPLAPGLDSGFWPLSHGSRVWRPLGAEACLWAHADLILSLLWHTCSCAYHSICIFRFSSLRYEGWLGKVRRGREGEKLDVREDDRKIIKSRMWGNRKSEKRSKAYMRQQDCRNLIWLGQFSLKTAPLAICFQSCSRCMLGQTWASYTCSRD